MKTEKELQKELKIKLREWNKTHKYNKETCRYEEYIFDTVTGKPHIIRVTYCEECCEDENFDERKCIGCKLENKVKYSYVSGGSLLDGLSLQKDRMIGSKAQTPGTDAGRTPLKEKGEK